MQYNQELYEVGVYGGNQEIDYDIKNENTIEEDSQRYIPNPFTPRINNKKGEKGESYLDEYLKTKEGQDLLKFHKKHKQI